MNTFLGFLLKWMRKIHRRKMKCMNGNSSNVTNLTIKAFPNENSDAKNAIQCWETWKLFGFCIHIFSIFPLNQTISRWWFLINLKWMWFSMASRYIFWVFHFFPWSRYKYSTWWILWISALLIKNTKQTDLNLFFL